MENQYMENSVDPFLKNTPLFRVNFFESATLLFLSEKIESLKMQLLRLGKQENKNIFSLYWVNKSCYKVNLMSPSTLFFITFYFVWHCDVCKILLNPKDFLKS